MEQGETGDVSADTPADSASQEATQPSGDDYWGRVASDPEFAIEQIKKRDAKTTEQANRLQALEQVEQMVKVANGPDQLLNLASTGARIDQIPGLRELVNQSFETGQLALPQAAANGPEEEEWIDPDFKPYADKISALEAQINSLSATANAANVRSMEQRVDENIRGALEMFAGSEEAMAEARNVIEGEYRAALAAAERGDPVQSKLIDDLAKPGGKRILETVLFDTYRKHAPTLVAASKTQSPTEEVAPLGRLTDERSTTVTRPGTPQLPPLQKGRVSPEFVLRSLMAAGAAKGIDASKL